MARDSIRTELRGVDNWITREEPIDDAGSWEPSAVENHEDYINGLRESGALHPIGEAPKDGSPFKAIIADTGEKVTARYDTEHAWWLRRERWYDDEGDGAPDGGCRSWEAEDFAGWLPPATSDAP